MAARECTEVLQWALPQVGLQWDGFRKVRRQVCRRLDLRRRELGLPTVGAYRGWLESHPDEWPRFEVMCRITISRFYRDRATWDALRELLPDLPRGDDGVLEAWSTGCASGEEAWTLRLIADFDPQAPPIRVLATDVDPAMLDRARAARYPAGCLRELPREWREAAFHRSADALRLEDAHRHGVAFSQCDLRDDLPRGPFGLILCRNLAFTYFDASQQRRALERLTRRLLPGGVLVVGRYEEPPVHPELASAGPALLGRAASMA